MQEKTLTVQPGSLHGTLTVPPSKSVMQRICAAVWVRGGSACITNPGNSADDLAMLELMKAAGCIIHTDKQGKLLIQAVKADHHTLDSAHFGESGLAARMCIPILALGGRDVDLDAHDSLAKRPMHFFEKVLPRLGVSVSMQEGHLPATISGRLTPANVTVDGSLSSQFITGLLMAYAGADARDVTITVLHPVSRPYIGLTLEIMLAAGLKVPERRSEDTFYFNDSEAPPLRPGITEFTVEGDWSAAAFWLVAGAIAGPISIRGLDVFSVQADKAVLTALMDSGAAVSIETKQITVSPAPLRAFQAKATDSPDLFPALAVLACYAVGTSVIEGIGRLKNKESNRAETIRLELGRLGADISLQDDYMVIRGTGSLHGGATLSHNDHRIAMMCAIAALRADAAVIIGDAGAVGKSYPGFFDDLASLGAAFGEDETT